MSDGGIGSAIGFVVKVVLASAAIAWLIREVLPRVDIPSTPGIALTIVLLPTVLMSVVLTFRLLSPAAESDDEG